MKGDDDVKDFLLHDELRQPERKIDSKRVRSDFKFPFSIHKTGLLARFRMKTRKAHLRFRSFWSVVFDYGNPSKAI